MRPAGLAAFEARSEERSAVYSYEQRYAAALEAAEDAQFRANEAAWSWFRIARRVLPSGRDLLGRQRQEAGNQGEAAGRSDRGVRAGPEPSGH